VATVREDIRNPTLRVNAAEIPLHVEAAQAEKLVYPVPISGAVERTSLSVDQKRASEDYNTDEHVGNVPVSKVAVKFGS
jgi:hypothetical protein